MDKSEKLLCGKYRKVQCDPVHEYCEPRSQRCLKCTKRCAGAYYEQPYCSDTCPKYKAWKERNKTTTIPPMRSTGTPVLAQDVAQSLLSASPSPTSPQQNIVAFTVATIAGILGILGIVAAVVAVKHHRKKRRPKTPKPDKTGTESDESLLTSSSNDGQPSDKEKSKQDALEGPNERGPQHQSPDGMVTLPTDGTGSVRYQAPSPSLENAREFSVGNGTKPDVAIQVHRDAEDVNESSAGLDVNEINLDSSLETPLKEVVSSSIDNDPHSIIVHPPTRTSSETELKEVVASNHGKPPESTLPFPMQEEGYDQSRDRPTSDFIFYTVAQKETSRN